MNKIKINNEIKKNKLNGNKLNGLKKDVCISRYLKFSFLCMHESQPGFQFGPKTFIKKGALGAHISHSEG